MRHHPIESGTIRKVWPAEIDMLREHFRRLDDESRRMRFGAPANDAFIETYCQRLERVPGVVHGFFVDDDLRAAAELHPLFGTRPPAAELAFSVERPWQDGGVGTALLERSLRTARNRGIMRLWMICLRENIRMQRIAHKFEAALHFDPGGVSGMVVAPTPNVFSLWHEGLDDGTAFVTALIDSTFQKVA